MELQSIPFRTKRLREYTCAQCHKSFAKQRYLKDHINSVYIKSVVCDFSSFKVVKKRKKRMETHLRAKHDFPTPATEKSSILSSSTTTWEMRPVTPPPDPAPSQSSTPCTDEWSLTALFPDFQESSLFLEDLPTLQVLVDKLEGSQLRSVARKRSK